MLLLKFLQFLADFEINVLIKYLGKYIFDKQYLCLGKLYMCCSVFLAMLAESFVGLSDVSPGLLLDPAVSLCSPFFLLLGFILLCSPSKGILLDSIFLFCLIFLSTYRLSNNPFSQLSFSVLHPKTRTQRTTRKYKNSNSDTKLTISL